MHTCWGDFLCVFLAYTVLYSITQPSMALKKMQSKRGGIKSMQSDNEGDKNVHSENSKILKKITIELKK